MIDVIRTLSIDEQIRVLRECQKVVQDAPLFRAVMPTGANFRYLCTSAGDYGWISDRKGFRYVSKHPVTGFKFPPIPDSVYQIAIDAAQTCGLALRPETALINWYDEESQLGLHQDRTESTDAPVVSISIGDDCVFIIGGPQRSDPRRKITLRSGDVLVMGAEHRFVFHGVEKIVPGTAPKELELEQPGRFNITVRQVYN
jgi:alkylated DNA repair protein (DNA oxidative demethylase)